MAYACKRYVTAQPFESDQLTTIHYHTHQPTIHSNNLIFLQSQLANYHSINTHIPRLPSFRTIHYQPSTINALTSSPTPLHSPPYQFCIFHSSAATNHFKFQFAVHLLLKEEFTMVDHDIISLIHIHNLSVLHPP